MEATEYLNATGRHARPKSEPIPPKPIAPKSPPRHAKGAHAKRGNPLLKIATGLVALAVVATALPALLALGMFFGILWAWLGRGLTKR